MAQSRSKKKNPWQKRLLLFVVIPFSVWFLAFLIWFNWSNVERLFSKNDDEPVPAKTMRRGEPADQTEKALRRDNKEKADGSQNSVPSNETRPKEKISDQDRKKLEEILKGER